MERDAADLRRSPRRGRTQPDAERRVAHGAARRREQARIEGSADCRIGRRRLKSQNSSTRSVLPDAKQQRRIAWAARIGGSPKLSAKTSKGTAEWRYVDEGLLSQRVRQLHDTQEALIFRHFQRFHRKSTQPSLRLMWNVRRTIPASADVWQRGHGISSRIF